MPDYSGIDKYNTPPWLQDQPGIDALLHKVLDKLDKNPAATPGFTLNQKLLPGLFDQDEQADLIWDLLQTLFDQNNPNQAAIFSYRENTKRNPLDAEYTDARIRFIADAEQQLRHWLNRPAQESELQQWKNAVEQNKTEFPGDVSRLSARNIAVNGKTSEDIINGFKTIKKYLDQTLTLRSLSARCFWQDSKFLDGKEEIVKLLYPEIIIKARPVLVSVHLPETIEGILFIENQDSYTQAMAGVPAIVAGLALVYSAGFKASAQRIREPEGVSLHFTEHSHQPTKEQFSQWWTEHSDNHWPVYFWGDLDYSGMDILANLKQRFDSIVAWQQGYQPMLELLLAGAGHDAHCTGKQQQKDPLKTGCHFADIKLLPVLRKYQRFVDQEWLC